MTTERVGGSTLTAFLVQAVTGVILAMYYKPDPDTAYASIQAITNDLTLGWLVRGLHYHGASALVVDQLFARPTIERWLAAGSELGARSVRFGDHEYRRVWGEDAAWAPPVCFDERVYTRADASDGCTRNRMTVGTSSESRSFGLVEGQLASARISPLVVESAFADKFNNAR